MNKSLKLSLAIAASCLTSLAFAADSATSMRGAEVTAPDQAPEIKTYVGKRPGTEAPVARTFSTQPPVIPHAVENFDEINLEGNQCMDCHSAATYQKRQPTRRRKHRRSVTAISSTATVRSTPKPPGPIQLRAMSRATGRRTAAGRQHVQGRRGQEAGEEELKQTRLAAFPDQLPVAHRAFAYRQPFVAVVCESESARQGATSLTFRPTRAPWRHAPGGTRQDKGDDLAAGLRGHHARRH